MNRTYKAIRFLGPLGAASILCMLIMAGALNAHAGPPAGGSDSLNYFLTVTVPYGLLAVLLVLPYSRMESGLWTASFAVLFLSGAYVLLYLLSHLPLEEWLLISAFVLLFLSQVVVIWLSRRTAPNQIGPANGSQPIRSQ